jgi:hypothetical protein
MYKEEIKETLIKNKAYEKDKKEEEKVLIKTK